MECRLSKLLLMGIWWPVFEGRGGGGGIQFPPPARLCCLDSLARDWREVGWHSRLPSHWESLEKVVSDLWRSMTRHRKNVAQQKAVRASVSQDLRLSLSTAVLWQSLTMSCNVLLLQAPPVWLLTQFQRHVLQVDRAWSAPACVTRGR